MTSTHERPGLTGTQFGRYRLDGLIDHGSVGEVYRAFDPGQDRTVALKILARKFAQDEEFRSRFRGESKIIAGMTHPHIVPVHEFGEVDGQLYLDMHLIDGRDLATVVREDGAGAPDRAVKVAIHVAWALSAAHAKGIVHRDVKPSNILTVPTGSSDLHAYLSDFGLARTVGGEGATRITSNDASDGTLEYMAPERFGGGPIDWRVDIYSLGCVLFESLTGRRPYEVTGLRDTANAHSYAPVPRPSQFVQGVPPALDDVVVTAMAKRPEERFQTAGAFAEACQRALGSGPFGPSASIPTQRRESSTSGPIGGATPFHAGQYAQGSWGPPAGMGFPPPGHSGRYEPTIVYPQPSRTRWWIPVSIIAAVLLVLGVAGAGVALVTSRDSAPPVVAPVSPPTASSAPAAPSTTVAPATSSVPTTSHSLTDMFAGRNNNCRPVSSNLFPAETEEIFCSTPSGRFTNTFAQYVGSPEDYAAGVKAKVPDLQLTGRDQCADFYAKTWTDSGGVVYNDVFMVYTHSPFSVVLEARGDAETLQNLEQENIYVNYPGDVCSGG